MHTPSVGAPSTVGRQPLDRRPAACSELDGDALMTLSATSWTVKQTSHRLLCDALRATVQAGSGAVGHDGSIRHRASAVLYMLLLDHPIDRRGRCRSCRRPSTIIGLRRRACRIHLRASYWLLHQPDDALLQSHLANEFRAGAASSSGAAPYRSYPTVTVRSDPRDPYVPPTTVEDDPSPDHSEMPEP